MVVVFVVTGDVGESAFELAKHSMVNMMNRISLPLN